MEIIRDNMDIPKHPSRLLTFVGLLIILSAIPAMYVLGFMTIGKINSTPKDAKVVRTFSDEKIDIQTQKDEKTFIYTDFFSIHRNDYSYEVRDTEGKEVPLTKLNGKRDIPLDGQLVTKFVPTASFTAPGGTVTFCAKMEGNSRGEFFIGEKIDRFSANWLLPFLLFIFGTLIGGLGLTMAIKNIIARRNWIDKYGQYE
ncbi:hypothetical protein [Porphyromonas crevioricanis]|nr:hypothetical protein [Porphyromonas crevioricanis]